jgi:hypothetical protein
MICFFDHELFHLLISPLRSIRSIKGSYVTISDSHFDRLGIGSTGQRTKSKKVTTIGKSLIKRTFCWSMLSTWQCLRQHNILSLICGELSNSEILQMCRHSYQFINNWPSNCWFKDDVSDVDDQRR